MGFHSANHILPEGHAVHRPFGLFWLERPAHRGRGQSLRTGVIYPGRGDWVQATLPAKEPEGGGQ
jgi:hypothetical protein